VKGESYVLLDSLREHDDSVDYYIYYLGYITAVPISWALPTRYQGVTTIDISYTSSEESQYSITESMTKAQEETWNVSASATAGVEIGGQAGVSPFASTSLKVSISATIGGGYGETISTSNTHETSKSEIYGTIDTISATIGEHNEPAGRYRFALMGVTDVFCIFKVDPITREINSVEIINCAREDTYAWGIDYEPDDNGFYGKTGGGDKFDIPDIDFTQVPVPTEKTEEPPGEYNPQTYRDEYYSSWEVMPDADLTNVSYNYPADVNIDSKSNKETYWILDIRFYIAPNADSKNIFADFRYVAMEGGGDNTQITITKTMTLLPYNRNITSIDMNIDGNGYYYNDGHLRVKKHDWNTIDTLTSSNFKLPLTELQVKLDGAGNDDRYNIGAKGWLRVNYTYLE
jgi:hypothetical protein